MVAPRNVRRRSRPQNGRPTIVATIEWHDAIALNLGHVEQEAVGAADADGPNGLFVQIVPRQAAGDSAVNSEDHRKRTGKLFLLRA